MTTYEPPTPTRDVEAELAEQLAEIARVLLRPGTVNEILQRIVTLSTTNIDGCDESGLCAADGRSVPTSPVVAVLDQLQTSLREGPCVDAMSGLNSVYVDELESASRWPQFGAIAAESGFRSALAYRLFSGDETLGALQLYAHLPAAFNATDRAQGLIFAAHAGMALAVAQGQADERSRIEHLQTALNSREIIGQAQGILMERERITADKAFDLLRRASQHLNIKLRDVAQELVDTGSVPGDQSTTSPAEQAEHSPKLEAKGG